MDWKEALKAIREALGKLTLADGKLADVKIGAVEGDETKPGQSFDELLVVLETGLQTAGTDADGHAAELVKLRAEVATLQTTTAEQKTKLDAAGDVDARVATAEGKTTKLTERAIKAETALRSSRILTAARDKLDELGLPPEQRKTAVALLNVDLTGVEVDDAGVVSGLDKRIATLKTAHSHVFKIAKGGGGPAGDGGGDAGGTTGAGAGNNAADGSSGGAGDGDDRYSRQLEAAFGVTPPAAATNATAA